MKKILLMALTATLLSGCMNLYTRNPFNTKDRIESVYQSSGYMVGFSWVVMFPQTMAPSGGAGFMAANLISIPCGVICYADTLLEAVVDTVCLPYDIPVSNARRGKK